MVKLKGVDLSQKGAVTVHGNGCAGLIKRSEKHDAYYCEKCGWLEAKCSDPDCLFCKARPITPKEIINGKT